MATLFFTVGIIPGDNRPIRMVTRRIAYDSLETGIAAMSNTLIVSPLVDYTPLPPLEEEPVPDAGNP